MDNKMREIELEKVILHCTTGDQQKLEKYVKLLEMITGRKPIKTLAKKRIPSFKIRPGLVIGCKVTLRKKEAEKILKLILTGVKEIKESQVGPGHLNFGIKEYIEIPSLSYNREIGLLGFDVSVVLKRKGGFKKRKKIGKSHMISREETIQFFKKNFNIKIV
ncbi:MAG: 50S ribosomal protein L5 [Candidatus Pacearchaeota archaeon]|nr:50S ribosomal protein L5 [Candidatus Pacearchaeota archaeon]